jgi:glycine hydroxymethyltransferase
MTEQERMARPLAEADPEIWEQIVEETERQNSRLELIASENFTSEAVLQAAGSVFTNKYAEGYPGKRYYGGCEHADVVESLARERAQKLFDAEYVNVQPHSGSQANEAAYAAVLNPGDTILGMNLAHGGHLTHGHQLNFSGKLYKIVPYGVRRDDERIDYEALEKLADEHKPKMIIAGGSAYPRTLDFPRFRQIADQSGSLLLVDMAHFSGLVAAGLHPNPCKYADIVTSTTHKTLRGPRSGMIFAREKYAAAIDRSVFPGVQGGPLVHVIAAKAVCFKQAMTPEFVEYSRQVLANARILAYTLGEAGCRVVSGGTDTHLMLVDVFAKGVRGREAELALDRAYITANKNAIPFDVNPPLNPSGMRFGSPAVTTRGFRETEMQEVAELIVRVLENVSNEEVLSEVRTKVGVLTERFPLYAWKLGGANIAIGRASSPLIRRAMEPDGAGSPRNLEAPGTAPGAVRSPLTQRTTQPGAAVNQDNVEAPGTAPGAVR